VPLPPSQCRSERRIRTEAEGRSSRRERVRKSAPCHAGVQEAMCSHFPAASSGAWRLRRPAPRLLWMGLQALDPVLRESVVELRVLRSGCPRSTSRMIPRKP
jgi:hypothetical protein